MSAVILVLLGGLPRDVPAQASHPIYLQYDGFVKNRDGTFTLSFGYFNITTSM